MAFIFGLSKIFVKITRRGLTIIQHWNLVEYESKSSLWTSDVTQELLYQILPFRANQAHHK
jgi:hypothetical protein